MEKKFFDWEDDPELTSDAKVTNLPLTGEYKSDKRFEDLEDGFSYSDKGMLEKEVTIRPNVITYDPEKVKTDSEGRTYFLNENGYPIYFDALGNAYGIMINENNEVIEYIPFSKNERLYFKNPEHTIGVLKDGSIYEYDSVVGDYVYNSQIKNFPTNGKTR